MTRQSAQRHVAVVGGGLAGLAAAAALGSVGHKVTLFEARPFFGGRATSYPLNSADSTGPTIDNCQHVLLRCCTNLLDFYRRLHVEDRIHFSREFYWIEPGGRLSLMRAGRLPRPLHFTGSFAKLRFLSVRAKVDVARGLLAVQRDYHHRHDLDQITMLDWLQEKRQGPQAIERFWRQVLVSAINEDLERMAAVHGLQVFWLGFLSRGDSYQMGIPSVPLAHLYSAESWREYPLVELRPRCPVQEINIAGGQVASLKLQDGSFSADAYVSALPFERLDTVAPDANVKTDRFTHSPITGIHLWFDRPITRLPHATLLDRTIQWMFNKEGGRHIQLVVSASRKLVEMPRQEIIDLVLSELKDFFPAVANARLERAHVVKEIRATFSAGPGLEWQRPASATTIPNLFLAGDWTRSGWPATMEGAVRSGYLAAEAVTAHFGDPMRFLRPDVA